MFFKIKRNLHSCQRGSQKYIFSREALISGEEWPENSGEMGNNRDIYCYASWVVVNLEILVMPQFSYMSDQILGKNEKNSIFRPKFDLSLGSSPP